MARNLGRIPITIMICIIFISVISCVGRRARLCGEGGQPAREILWKGDKQCDQVRDKQGRWINEGSYREFYSSGKRALQGEYKNGEKNGTWSEYNEDGKKISERYFVDGVEVPSRTAINPDDKRK